MPRRGASISRILPLLRSAYGPRPAQCWGDGVSVLVDTILSQNTNAANSDAGFRQLRRRFRSWNRVADAPVEEVERHIRVSGLSNQKAPRIQSILRRIRDQQGRINLQFLKEMPDEEAYNYLRSFPGVGPKTAACTLLFAFNKALFPVDTHIHRIARRLTWVGPRATAEQTHDLLDPSHCAEGPLRDARPADRAREKDLQGIEPAVREVCAAEVVSVRAAAYGE